MAATARRLRHCDPLPRARRGARGRQGARALRGRHRRAGLPGLGLEPTKASRPKHAAELNLNLEDRRLRLTLDLARQLIGIPRHLSQHPGGFVLTRDRLDELVPIEPAAMEDRR